MEKTTQKLVGSALLAALSVIFARLMGMMPSESARFSIEAVPIFLAGLLYGPLYGSLVGFSADFVGCLFSPYGYNPLFCLPPILYGLFGGFLRLFLLKQEIRLWKLALGLVPPVLFGSILWQSFVLALTYGSEATLRASYLVYLTARSVQFAVTYGIDLLLIALLCRSNIFYKLGLLPLWKRRETGP